MNRFTLHVDGQFISAGSLSRIANLADRYRQIDPDSYIVVFDQESGHIVETGFSI